jgi:predicted secreted Zn-dependent protease
MTEWRKSSRSGMNGCVAVAIEPPVILVRHSHDPDGPRLSFTMAEWDAFLAGVADHEFDLPKGQP